jgi:hypothetical protein
MNILFNPRNMLRTHYACHSQAGADEWETTLRYPGRRHPNAEVFRRLQHCVREKGSIKCRSPTDCVELHNCSCGTRTVENLTLYRKKIGTVPTKRFRNTSWRSVCGAHFLLHTIALYGYNFTIGCICTLRLSCFLRCSLPTCDACVVREAVFNV